MFFIVWGFRVRFRTLSQGVFFCPSCGGDRQYNLQQAKRWFTLFWLPLIPLKDVGEPFVQCTTCRNAYKPAVLNQPTSAALSESLVTAMRGALVWLLRVEAPTPTTIAAAVEVLSATAQRPWSEAELEADVAQLDLGGLANQLAGLAGALNDHGRERFLADCTRVAAADGVISDGERNLLNNVASSLTMTPAHAMGVITQVAQQAGI
jgi:hypothetical protein